MLSSDSPKSETTNAVSKNDSNKGSIFWPEDIAKETSFYFNKDNDGDNANKLEASATASATHKYHLSFRTLKSQSGSKIQNQLILYNGSTNEIVDVMNANDIIGVQLEISIGDEEHEHGHNNKNDKNSRSDYTFKVGQGNIKAKERAEKMETYEQEIGKALLAKAGGIVDDDFVQVKPASNLFNHFDENDNKEVKKKSMISTSSSAHLNIFCYPRKLPKPGMTDLLRNCFVEEEENHEIMDENQLGHRYEHHRRYKLHPTEDFTNVQFLIPAIRRVTDLKNKEEPPVDNDYSSSSVSNNTSSRCTTTVQTKRYLVIVNPFSGQKQGKHIYESKAKKMFHESGIDHDVFITQYEGHAIERMQLKQQVMNGNDYNNDDDDDNHNDVTNYDAIIALGGDGILSEIINGLKNRRDYSAIIQKMKFGIVGCGTCNGLAASLLYATKEKYGVLDSLFLICKGRTSKLDLATYVTKNKQYTSFLTMSWAMIADIDIESECLRFAGALRNDIWGVWRVLNLRSYKAKFSYLPPDKVEIKMKSLTSTITKDKEDDNLNCCPSFDSNVPSNWVTIEADFILFWASLVSHASYNVLQSPQSQLQDGLFRVWIVRKPCSRIHLAGMLIQMENGKHIEYDNAEFYDCVAFRLDPISQGSFNDVDGEVVEPGRIQGCVEPIKLTMFS